MKRQHHSKYVSNQQVIHKCLLTYQEVSPNMPFSWYVQNVYDSTNRKGYVIDQGEVETWIYHFMKWEGLDVCRHCMGTGRKHEE